MSSSSAHPTTSVPNLETERSLRLSFSLHAVCRALMCILCVHVFRLYIVTYMCLLIVQKRSRRVCVGVRAHERVCVLCKRRHQPMGAAVESASVD